MIAAIIASRIRVKLAAAAIRWGWAIIEAEERRWFSGPRPPLWQRRLADLAQGVLAGILVGVAFLIVVGAWPVPA